MCVRVLRETRKWREKSGSSHGPSSLLVHYICFTDALSSSGGFYRKRAVNIHFTHERNSTMSPSEEKQKRAKGAAAVTAGHCWVLLGTAGYCGLVASSAW